MWWPKQTHINTCTSTCKSGTYVHIIIHAHVFTCIHMNKNSLLLEAQILIEILNYIFFSSYLHHYIKY